MGNLQPVEGASHSHTDAQAAEREEMIRGQFSFTCVQSSLGRPGVVGVLLCPVARLVVESSLK